MGRCGRGFLSIPFGEKMNNTINFRCVTDVASVQFHLKEFFKSLRWKSKVWAFGQMVYKCVDFGEIHGANKKFHAMFPFRKENK